MTGSQSRRLRVVEHRARARSAYGTLIDSHVQARRRGSRACRSRVSPAPPHCGHSVLTKSSRSASGRPVAVDRQVRRQHDRQLLLRHRHDAAVVAVDDRDRRAPARWRQTGKSRDRVAARAVAQLGLPRPQLPAGAASRLLRAHRASVLSASGMPSEAVAPWRASTIGETSTGSGLGEARRSRSAGRCRSRLDRAALRSPLRRPIDLMSLAAASLSSSSPTQSPSSRVVRRDGDEGGLRERVRLGREDGGADAVERRRVELDALDAARAASAARRRAFGSQPSAFEVVVVLGRVALARKNHCSSGTKRVTGSSQRQQTPPSACVCASTVWQESHQWTWRFGGRSGRARAAAGTGTASTGSAAPRT